MVSETTFFLQNSTQPLSRLPDNLHKFFHNTRSSTQRHLEEPVRRAKVYQLSFFPYCIQIWNGLDLDLQNTDSYKQFKSKILPFTTIKSNSIFSVHEAYGVKLNFSHLNEHKGAKVSFLIKLQARATGTSVSCEFCEICKNTFFTEHLCTTTSETIIFRKTELTSSYN